MKVIFSSQCVLFYGRWGRRRWRFFKSSRINFLSLSHFIPTGICLPFHPKFLCTCHSFKTEIVGDNWKKHFWQTKRECSEEIVFVFIHILLIHDSHLPNYVTLSYFTVDCQITVTGDSYSSQTSFSITNHLFCHTFHTHIACLIVYSFIDLLQHPTMDQNPRFEINSYVNLIIL